MKLQACALALALFALGAGCATTKDRHAPGDSAASLQAFETLKSLAGQWHGTTMVEEEASPVDLTLEVVSGNSAVMERLFVGTPHEMITLYHLDGDRLMLTHYCVAGNQPRMELRGWTASPEATLNFSFVDATNWAGGEQLIMHDVRISKLDSDHFCSSWTAWTNGAPDHISNFNFTRRL